jgi:hypothetical protein
LALLDELSDFPLLPFVPELPCMSVLELPCMSLMPGFACAPAALAPGALPLWPCCASNGRFMRVAIVNAIKKRFMGALPPNLVSTH